MSDTPPPLNVELHPHSPAWAGMAEAERARLKAALGDTLVTVLHIGSTAIPGIMAKPIVDLMPLVTDLDALDARRSAIEALGYRWYGEFGLAGRRYCVLVDPATGTRVFQLHCYRQDAPEIPRHVAFRDFLRAHPAIASEYEAEKIRAASVASHDVNLYNDEKNAWIKRMEKDALAWRAANPASPAP
ncbi:MAG: GrpB family protein [Rhizomicrobium sp.]